MSILLKDPNKSIFLLTKGADSVMLDKISFEKSEDDGIEKKVDEDLYSYSSDGLRTLVMAQRHVRKSEYKRFMHLLANLQESHHPMKEKKIKELFSKMESKLRYIGCTAIEDKLQDGVPEAIAKILDANIRFFMLTGDKMETAIEIAKSCRLV